MNSSAKIVADSVSPQGHRITTMELIYPKCVHSDLMTHRVFSRNAASSRAIPFSKMVEAVKQEPFIPLAFQSHHSGMQGSSYLEGQDYITALHNWNVARAVAIESAEDLYRVGVTKQLCNRILEPFSYTKMLVTATDWQGFFDLRCPQYESIKKPGVYYKSKRELLQDMPEYGWNTPEEWLVMNRGLAEIHLMDLAEKMYDAYNSSVPTQLSPGDWHVPYQDKIDRNEVQAYVDKVYPVQPDQLSWSDSLINEVIRKIAIMMCARISYTTIDQDQTIWTIKKYVDKYQELIDNKHMSPTEHVAKCMNQSEHYHFIRGRGDTNQDFSSDSFGRCNNFQGWIQERYIIENL